MTDELEVLIHWEINELKDRLEALKKDLRSMMIDRNTAALRVVAMDNAGFSYPEDIENLESWDSKVEETISQVNSIRKQLSAWEGLLRNFHNPEVQIQVKPMIRTVELQQQE